MVDPFPQLETERLLLRQLTLRDVEAIYTIFADDAVTRYYDLETFTAVEQAEQLITRINDRFSSGQGIRWGIVRKADNQLIGTGGYNVIIRPADRGVIGYDLARSAWGQGIMPEALAAIIRYGFEQLNLYRIEALVMIGNTQSERVLTKLGFQAEGVLRGWGYWKGAHWDLRSFSLLRTDSTNQVTEFIKAYRPALEALAK